MKTLSLSFSSMATLATALTAIPVSAAVIVNPTVVSGAGNSIAPGNAQLPDVSFGTAETTLEARTDLNVLQSFNDGTNSFEGIGDAGENIVSFTGGSLPDIRFSISGANASATAFGEITPGGVTGNRLRTSDDDALLVRNDGAGSYTVLIEFGSFDGTNFTADQTVDAAGFTLAGLFSGTNNLRSGTVAFKDATGNTITGTPFAWEGLSNQDGSGDHRDIYFGWDADAEGTDPINSIELVINDQRTSGASSGFDDLAFTPGTVIPEPGSLALLGAGVALLIGHRRRSNP